MTLGAARLVCRRPGRVVLGWLPFAALLGACGSAAAHHNQACAGCAATVSVPAAVHHGHWEAVSRPVVLVPALQAGDGGWCVTLGHPDGCKAGLVEKGPILVESWSAQAVGSSMWTAEASAITEPSVAAVSLERSRFLTRRAPQLPDHLRALVVRKTFTRSEGSPTAQRLPPRLRPLSASGRPIPQHGGGGEPLLYSLPVETWRAPGGPPPSAICQIRATGPTPLFAAEGGSVVTRLVPGPTALGNPFVSCASTRYNDALLRASVLLDARHPGSTPAALPGMLPLRGHPGIFIAPGAESQMLARRVPHAWLVIGGYNVVASVKLLEALTATVV